MPGAEGLSVHQPVMKAGDVVVWNNLLPHGSGLNTSAAPRIGYNLGLNPISTMRSTSFSQLIQLTMTQQQSLIARRLRSAQLLTYFCAWATGTQEAFRTRMVSTPTFMTPISRLVAFHPQTIHIKLHLLDRSRERSDRVSDERSSRRPQRRWRQSVCGVWIGGEPEKETRG